MQTETIRAWMPHTTISGCCEPSKGPPRNRRSVVVDRRSNRLLRRTVLQDVIAGRRLVRQFAASQNNFTFTSPETGTTSRLRGRELDPCTEGWILAGLTF
ncbi:hypothetical protein PISMIDRAFT_222786 [Pisolithus microcarpus 441]|uniref:Uncharacterized protein n=1 Tax=Pisolithus microcarpus 441 TaxID=765257 RepID=A0A0C9YLM5_9AGAM|nr:hypothetical protein PISMIDRAFT_222786 [Pisolithus microcarpus 441]